MDIKAHNLYKKNTMQAISHTAQTQTPK